MFTKTTKLKIVLIIAIMLAIFSANSAFASGLDAVLESGTLRHLGIPYANFVTTDHAGLDVELMQSFAKYLGVKYQYVESTWGNIISDLSGKTFTVNGDNITITGTAPIKGDIISTGFTVLPWREKIVDFSAATFPSGIWLIASSESSIAPIKPSGDVNNDISMVKNKLPGVSVLGMEGSCLAPELYGIKETGARVMFFPVERDLEEMIPSVIAKIADSTLMDVPVALIALEKWPRQIKVVGPLSTPQDMACAFAKDTPELKHAFDNFFAEFKSSGKYRKLVADYYPTVFTYYPYFLVQK